MQLLNLNPVVRADSHHIFHAMILPGPKQPKNANIFTKRICGIFNKLWHGIDGVNDVSTGETFVMRGYLLLTVNDWPGRAWLHSYQEQGSLNPCPKCMVRVCIVLFVHVYVANTSCIILTHLSLL